MVLIKIGRHYHHSSYTIKVIVPNVKQHQNHQVAHEIASELSNHQNQTVTDNDDGTPEIGSFFAIYRTALGHITWLVDRPSPRVPRGEPRGRKHVSRIWSYYDLRRCIATRGD